MNGEANQEDGATSYIFACRKSNPLALQRKRYLKQGRVFRDELKLWNACKLAVTPRAH